MRKVLIIAGFMLGWFALIFQFIILLKVTKYPPIFTVVNFFSYFTILTNIITAICFTLLLFKRDSSVILRPAILTAVAVYITIVGVVYNVILRFIWSPVGLAMVVDELLHTVIPLLFISFWVLYVPKDGLLYRLAFVWLIYPVVYIIFSLIRGSLTAFYPYPFIDVNSLGYNEVFVNIGLLILVVMFFSFVYIGVGRYLANAKNQL